MNILKLGIRNSNNAYHVMCDSILAANNMSRQANQAILQAAKVGDAATVTTFLERLERLYGGANPYYSDEVCFASVTLLNWCGSARV